MDRNIPDLDAFLFFFFTTPSGGSTPTVGVYILGVGGRPPPPPSTTGYGQKTGGTHYNGMHMSHFAYPCKMRYPLNLVLESWEYLWFY